MTGQMMEFPETFDEFVDSYGFVDTKEVYTNGSQLIPVFRVKQWLEHITPQPKMGQWILTSDDEYEYCTCSECGYQNGENWMIGSCIKFCQECGADMRGKA